jgi:hypothetical protein
MAPNCNPIIGQPVEIFPWSFFAPRPLPRPGIAVVLVKEGQASIALEPGDTSALRQIKWRDYQLAYYVDVGTRTFSFTCALPSQNAGLSFQADTYVTYRVVNPLAIIQRKITDACAILEPLLIQPMRSVSRRYELDKWSEAEQTIATLVMSTPRRDNFEISNFAVTLSVDEDEREHARRMRVLKRNHEYRKEVITSNSQLPNVGLEQLLILELADHPEALRDVLHLLDKHFENERVHWIEMLKLLQGANGLQPQHLEKLRDHILARYPDIGHKHFAKALSASQPGSAATNGSKAPSPAPGQP